VLLKALHFQNGCDRKWEIFTEVLEDGGLD
jgi:hypothetical protein